MSEFRIGNIKGSFTFPKNAPNCDKLKTAIERLSKEVKTHRNFIVLRLQYVYIIFPSSGYVNATKLRNLSEVKECMKEFETATGIIQHSKFRIHNIHAFGRLTKTLNLHQYRQHIGHRARSEDILVSFNPSLFHGMKIRVKDLGTFILFQSGNYSLLGVRSVHRLQELAKRITDLISF